MSFTFQIPDRAVMKGPNFIRKVFERGAGIPGFISFGIGNPASEAIPVSHSGSLRSCGTYESD